MQSFGLVIPPIQKSFNYVNTCPSQRDTKIEKCVLINVVSSWKLELHCRRLGGLSRSRESKSFRSHRVRALCVYCYLWVGDA